MELLTESVNATFLENVTSPPVKEVKSSSPNHDSLYVVIPITVLYCLIFVAGIVGNVITILVIRRNKHMHTTTNLYLLSLACSDLLLLVSGLPQEMWSIWSKRPYIFGEMFCILRGLAAETSTNATVLTITAFTVERYIAICHPFLSHKMSRLSRAVKLIILIWCVGLGCAIPQALQFGVIHENTEYAACAVKTEIIPHSFEISTFLFFVAPMLLITIFYALIGIKLRRSNMMRRESDENGRKNTNASQITTTQARTLSLRSRTNSGIPLTRRSTPSAQSCRHQQTAQSSKRVLKMLVAVVVAFFICWAPFHAQRLVYIYGNSPTSQPSQAVRNAYIITTYISGILYYVSTAVNPVLYHIMSRKFREAFKESLTQCCGMSQRHDAAQRAHYAALHRTRAGLHGYYPGIAMESTTGSGSQTDEYRHRTTSRSTNTNSSVCPISSSMTNNGNHVNNECSKSNNGNTRWWHTIRCLRDKNCEPDKLNSEEVFNMFPAELNDISNSSLKDVDKAALEAELAEHLAELHTRDRS